MLTLTLLTLGPAFLLAAILNPTVRVVWVVCFVVGLFVPAMARRWVLTDKAP